MFGSLTVYDGMTQVLSRIFRVPVNNKPITIVELTGLPTEIINVVVSVLARMTFDFAHWSEGKVPLTLVCEEAHRYVPAADHLGFEPCKRAIAKIAKEGRKYGVALCIVSQRPAEVDPTILSQCNTVFALRMSNDRDQEIVTSAITDTGSGLLGVSALARPARGAGIRRRRRPAGAHQVRRAAGRTACRASTTARFTEHWQRSVGDEGFLEHVVEKWRTSDIGAGGDLGQMTLIAEGLAPDSMVPPLPEPPRHADGRRAEPHQPLRREPDPQRQAAYGARPGAPASARPTTLRNPPEPAIERSSRRGQGRARLGAEVIARPAHPAPAALSVTARQSTRPRIARTNGDDPPRSAFAAPRPAPAATPPASGRSVAS